MLQKKTRVSIFIALTLFFAALPAFAATPTYYSVQLQPGNGSGAVFGYIGQNGTPTGIECGTYQGNTYTQCSGVINVDNVSETNLSAYPNLGITFAGWTNCPGYNTTETFGGDCYLIEGVSRNIIATFAQGYIVTPYTNKVFGVGSGINPSVPFTVPLNGTATFTMTPDVGWGVYNITGCNVSYVGTTQRGIYTEYDYILRPTSNCTVTALFAPQASPTPALSPPAVIFVVAVLASIAYRYRKRKSTVNK